MEIKHKWIDIDTALQMIEVTWGGIFDTKSLRAHDLLRDRYGERLTNEEVLEAWQVLNIDKSKIYEVLLKVAKLLE